MCGIALIVDPNKILRKSAIDAMLTFNITEGQMVGVQSQSVIVNWVMCD